MGYLESVVYAEERVEYRGVEGLKEIALYECVPISELPSNISTMGYLESVVYAEERVENRGVEFKDCRRLRSTTSLCISLLKYSWFFN